MGLIEAGNPEVIMDKIARVGDRGMVIFDRVSPRSTAPQVAEDRQVAFIQIRNNRPLTAIHQHLRPLVAKTLIEPPDTPQAIGEALKQLPDSLFIPG